MHGAVLGLPRFIFIHLFFSKVLTKLCEYDIIVKHDLYAPVAQLVEHLTFNQRVRDSSSRRSTNRKEHPCGALFYWCPCVARISLSKDKGFATLQPPSLWEACQRLQNSRRSEKKHPVGCFFYITSVRDLIYWYPFLSRYFATSSSIKVMSFAE